VPRPPQRSAAMGRHEGTSHRTSRTNLCERHHRREQASGAGSPIWANAMTPRSTATANVRQEPAQRRPQSVGVGIAQASTAEPSYSTAWAVGIAAGTRRRRSPGARARQAESRPGLSVAGAVRGFEPGSIAVIPEFCGRPGPNTTSSPMPAVCLGGAAGGTTLRARSSPSKPRSTPPANPSRARREDRPAECLTHVPRRFRHGRHENRHRARPVSGSA
jgi:hypothetical protein